MRAPHVLILAAWSMFALESGLASPSQPQAEGARIREHLSRVERQLRAGDVSRLDHARRAAREAALDALHVYWRAGVFPHNHDFPGVRRPYFVDRHGTRCAMAYVIEHAGGAKLVARVSRTANNARVRELAGDPELIAWLDRNGMTAEEAALVQPEYGYRHPYNDPSREYHWDVAVLALEVSGVALNMPRSSSWESRRLCGIYGFIGGIVGGSAGLARMNNHPGLGQLEAYGGLLMFGLAVHNLNHPPREVPVLAASHPNGGWSATPGVNVSAEGVPQLAVSVTF